MRIHFLPACLLLPLLSVAAEPVWQLGEADNSCKEFQPYSRREFMTSAYLLNSPDYDKKNGTFTFRITRPGVNDVSGFPAALTGATYGNETPLRKLRLVWNENADGFRELEFKIVAAEDIRQRMLAHRRNPNANLDIDGKTWVESGVRVATPGNRAIFKAVPYDVEQYIAKHGPIVVKIAFPVRRGENVLELAETSGASHEKVFQFDYLKLTSLDADRRPAPHADFIGHEKFLNNSVYRVGDPAGVGLEIRNLKPDSTTTAAVKFVDHRGNTVASRSAELTADADGFARTIVPVPEKRSGHFRVRVMLPDNPTPLAETRIAGVREIAPLTEKEVDLSFIGFCGLDLGLFVYPDQDPDAYAEKFSKYAVWQKILQVRHERIHSLCWSFVEPSEHDYHWGPWDRMIKSQLDNNIRVQLTLIGTPKWLMDRSFPGKKYSHVGKIYFAPPPDMNKWREFCKLVAQRYGDSIKEFEIWNEVSGQSMFWVNGNAGQFVELVKNAGEAIKSVHPEARIVAETVWPRQDEFVRQIFDLGIARYVDIHADHYIEDARIARDRALVDRYAQGALLISNESKMDGTGYSNPLGMVDELSRREAAAKIIRNFLYANSHGFNRIYNYRIVGNTWRMWGIVGPDNTPKYSFSAVKTLINRTAGAKFETYHRLSGTLELFIYRYVTPGRAESNGGETLAVLCNSGKKTESLMLPTLTDRCLVVDMMDNACETAAPDKIVKLEVGDEPVMLIGLDLAAMDQLAKLEIRQGKKDLRPEEPTEFEIALPGGARGNFTVERSDGQKQQFQLNAGEHRVVSLPNTARNTIVTLKLSGELEFPDRKLPLTRYLQYIISEQAAGVSLLPPLDDKNWQVWGGAKADFSSGNVAVDVNAGTTTGALRPRRLLKVIPNARYVLTFRAKGTGRLRVMFNGITRTGESRVLSHNMLSNDLKEQWSRFHKEWVCPSDTTRIEMDFYEYREAGRFELADLSFVRLQDDIPINRQLCKVAAAAGTPELDGKLSGFRIGSFQKITESTFAGNLENPIEAKFAVAADSRNLYIAVRVKDKIHHGGPSANQLWKGDSIQIGLDLSDGSRKVRSVEFGFGLVNGEPVSYRFRTLPTEDIVPTYRTGENPAGVKTIITRIGDETRYEVAIPAEAIHPQLALQPGMKLGFALLVNQNDGNGRLGFLRWSGGIGEEANSQEFGELTLPEKLP